MNAPLTIDEYLDALADSLALPLRRVRRVLLESEDHLRSATAALVAEGLAPAEAEARAIERFGAPDLVARSFSSGPVDWLGLTLALMDSLGGIAVAGLVAIGLSGVVALTMSGVLGRDFVAGDAPGVTYTASRCDDLFALEPQAADCNDAATSHHFDEIVVSRLFAGIVGLLALGPYFWLRSRSRGSRRLPLTFAPTVGASIFGVATLGLLFMSMPYGQQSGAMLSGALVSGVVATTYALRLSRLLGFEAKRPQAA